LKRTDIPRDYSEKGYGRLEKTPGVVAQGTCRSLTVPKGWAKIVVIDITDEPDVAIAEAEATAEQYAVHLRQKVAEKERRKRARSRTASRVPKSRRRPVPRG
jgi:hypothetical protein